MKPVLYIKRVRLIPLAAATAAGAAAALLLVLLTSALPVAAQKAFSQTSAPELVGSSWLNTPKNAPVTLTSRKGKVTILHFWTFG